MRRLALFVTLIALAIDAARVPGAPYPIPSAGLNSTSLLFVIDETQISPDSALLAASLQGLVSRESPAVYRILGNSSIYAEWLKVLEMEFNVAVSYAYDADPASLVHKLRPDLSGYILAQLNDSSSVSAALTAAALLDAVVATPVTAPELASFGYNQLYDLRGSNVSWVLATLNGTAASSGASINPSVTVLQDPAKVPCLSDWSLFARAANWWSTDMTDPLSTRIWHSISHGNAAVFGWGYSELDCVGAATSAGAWTHASDWARNLDVLCSFDIESFQQLPRASSLNTQKHSGGRHNAAAPSFPAHMFTPPSSPSDKVHTVTLLMTDGDNVQWLVSDFLTDANFWASPDRGIVPIGWTLSPALADLAPPIMSTLYATASRPNPTSGLLGSDVFVGAPSGVGYAYPDKESSSLLKPFATLTSAYMAKADMKYLNVLGIDFSDSASEELLSTSTVNGIIWYDYSSYSGLNGEVKWFKVPNANGTVQKPVVGGRFQLWDGVFDNVTTLAAKLLSQPRDASSDSGYSLIPVHVWTNNVTSVVALVQALAAGASDGSVRVVAPDVWMQALAANVPPKRNTLNRSSVPKEASRRLP